MKRSIITFLLFVMFASAKAQNCDIAQTGVAVFNETNSARVSSILPGERANFKFSIANFGTARDCSIPANGITAIFRFPTAASGIRPYAYDGPASFSSGYFTWNYDASTETLTGRNSSAIPNGTGDIDVLVKVIALSGGVASSELNLVAGNAVADNNANNFSQAQLAVAAGPVPVKLSAFTAQAQQCNAILNWRTSTESNFSHFEIEYSIDAMTYVKVGSLPGKNLASGGTYNFIYSQLNGKGYYRLKLVDRDGRFEMSSVEQVTTLCKNNPKILVYPNPVVYDQNLMVNISGYSGSITGEFFNEAGQRMKAYELVNGANTISVKEFAGGVYMLKVQNEGREKQSFKIIVTR